MKRSPERFAQPDEVPFSRPLAVDEVREDGLKKAIEADAAECEAVAKDLGLPSIRTLAADFRIVPRPGGRLHIDGSVSAKVTQICVVSLEAFESDVSQPIEIDFAPPPPTAADLGVRVPQTSRRRRDEPQPSLPTPVAEASEDDPPDPIVDGRIDLGAVAVEFLTLALDFYPRKPGVQFDDKIVGAADAPQATAFAVLERLKDRS